MGIHVFWDDAEKTTLVVAYHDPWKWEDYYAATQEIDHMLAESKAPLLGLISDFTNSRAIPANALTHFRRSATAIESSEGPTLFVMVDIKGIWQAVSMIMTRLYPKAAEKVRYAGSMEAARKLIEAHLAAQA